MLACFVLPVLQPSSAAVGDVCLPGKKKHICDLPQSPSGNQSRELHRVCQSSKLCLKRMLLRLQCSLHSHFKTIQPSEVALAAEKEL